MRRPWALPLLPLYWLGLRVKTAVMPAGQKRLKRPVISVGSLSAGGAGKTPVVKMLAALLHREGFAVDILSRGYGRGSGIVEEVDPTGHAARFGDEPLELAQAGWRVFVGADRFQAGALAEAQATDPGPSVHLLDDGFQHRRLARSVEIVLLTQKDAEDWLLPAGNLREPLSALRRADVILLREEEAAHLKHLLPKSLHAKVWITRRKLALPVSMPTRPIAFCGIARPENFQQMLSDAGCHPAGWIAWPDHHTYAATDVERLLQAAAHTQADGWVMTAKDAVKLAPRMRSSLETIGPLIVAELQVHLLDEAEAIRWLREKIAS